MLPTACNAIAVITPFVIVHVVVAYPPPPKITIVWEEKQLIYPPFVIVNAVIIITPPPLYDTNGCDVKVPNGIILGKNLLNNLMRLLLLYYHLHIYL